MKTREDLPTLMYIFAPLTLYVLIMSIPVCFIIAWICDAIDKYQEKE
jgi:hypothetical protein